MDRGVERSRSPMRNKKLVLVAVLAAFALLVAACGDDDGGEGAAGKMCQVTDFGGIDDQSFNQTAWAGFQQAEEELGVEIAYLESDDATDYAPNIQSFIDEGWALIVLAGYLSAGVTETGIVATFGGIAYPTVTIFMNGFAQGVAYYNEAKGTDVQV